MLRQMPSSLEESSAASLLNSASSFLVFSASDVINGACTGSNVISFNYYLIIMNCYFNCCHLNLWISSGPLYIFSVILYSSSYI